MSSYGPTLPELEALAARAGCRVVRVDTTHDGSPAYRLACRGHGAKVALLAELTAYDARDPRVRRLAEDIVAPARGDELESVERLHAYVCEHVAHREEPGEIFQHTLRTLEIGFGDCDDTARCLAALLRSVGCRVRLDTLGWPPRHVAPRVALDGVWWWVEPTLPGAQPGEHPIAAARRLAAVRADIG